MNKTIDLPSISSEDLSNYLSSSDYKNYRKRVDSMLEGKSNLILKTKLNWFDLRPFNIKQKLTYKYFVEDNGLKERSDSDEKEYSIDLLIKNLRKKYCSDSLKKMFKHAPSSWKFRKALAREFFVQNTISDFQELCKETEKKERIEHAKYLNEIASSRSLTPTEYSQIKHAPFFHELIEEDIGPAIEPFEKSMEWDDYETFDAFKALGFFLNTRKLNQIEGAETPESGEIAKWSTQHEEGILIEEKLMVSQCEEYSLFKKKIDKKTNKSSYDSAIISKDDAVKIASRVCSKKTFLKFFPEYLDYIEIVNSLNKKEDGDIEISFFEDDNAYDFSPEYGEFKSVAFMMMYNAKKEIDEMKSRLTKKRQDENKDKKKGETITSNMLMRIAVDIFLEKVKVEEMPMEDCRNERELKSRFEKYFFNCFK